ARMPAQSAVALVEHHVVAATEQPRRPQAGDAGADHGDSHALSPAQQLGRSRDYAKDPIARRRVRTVARHAPTYVAARPRDDCRARRYERGQEGTDRISRVCRSAVTLRIPASIVSRSRTPFSNTSARTLNSGRSSSRPRVKAMLTAHLFPSGRLRG